jgi:glycosyltransferase involved in cell wall biosynthesis
MFGSKIRDRVRQIVSGRQGPPETLRLVFPGDDRPLEDILDELDALGAPLGLFDPDWCRSELMAAGLASPVARPSEVAVLWGEHGIKRQISPTPVIDPQFYLQHHDDIRTAGADPLLHALETGLAEGRVAAAAFGNLVHNAHRIAGPEAGAVLLAFFCNLPSDPARALEDPAAIDLGRKLAHPEWHAVRHGLAMPEPAETLYWKVLLGLTPRPFSVLFNEDFYRSAWQDNRTENPQAAALSPHADAWVHWLAHGLPARVCPTPLFDEPLYQKRHPDTAGWPGWLFLHYAKHGMHEHRSASRQFDALWYAQRHKLEKGDAGLLHFAMTGDAQSLAPGQNLAVWGLPPAQGLVPTRLDSLYARRKALADRLQAPDILHMVEEAKALDPTVVRPYGVRNVHMMPLAHPALSLAQVGMAVEQALPHTRYDSVVLVPHCRMAGSARVAGALVQGLQVCRPDERVLVALTDVDVMERPDWFGDRVDIISLPQIAGKLGLPVTFDVVIDLLRGVNTKRVFNANSRIGWDMYTVAARPLSGEMALYAYLFTWDLDAQGNRGGYPIQSYLAAGDWFQGVLIDNTVLREELVERYLMPEELASTLVVAPSPVTDEAVADITAAIAERRRTRQPARILWAGRFDRQKRFELATEVATLMPDTEFLVYGKAVLADGKEIDATGLPPNMRLMGTFESLDEVNLASFDAYLYTSAWDGLPTILIDVGQRGLPDTAWTVPADGEAQAYVAELRQLLAQPDEAVRRARAMRELVNRRHSPAAFHSVVARLLESENDRSA